MDNREERDRCFLVSGCESTPLLEGIPEILDKMPIGPFWAGDQPITSFRWNGRSGSHVPYVVTKGIRRIVLVRTTHKGILGRSSSMAGANGH